MTLLAILPAQTLLAVGDGWITVVIMIVFFLITIVGKVLGKADPNKQPGGPPQGPRPEGNRPPQPRRPGQAAQPREPAGVQDEIADFLRRATQQGRAQQPAEAPEPPAPARIGAQEVPVEAMAVEDAPLGARLKEHVGGYFDEGRLARQSSQLGEQVGLSDERLDECLHEVFDHNVSRLTQKPGESSKSTSTTKDRLVPARQITAANVGPVAAVGFAALLSSNENLRQAIIINEILQRPLDRWK